MNRFATIGLGLLVASSSGAFAQQSFLTGMHLAGLGADHNWNGTGFDTAGPNQGSIVPWNLYCGLDGVPLNSGNGPETSINVPLTAGIYQLVFRTRAYFLAGQPYAMDLFFNGDATTPKISAEAFTLADASSPADFGPFGGLDAVLNFSTSVWGANAVAWTDTAHGLRIELMDLRFYEATAASGDFVSGYDSVPDGDPDQTGSLTLRVVAIPAPTSACVLGAFAVFTGRRSRRRN